MCNFSEIRHPFLPLSYDSRDKIITGELMIDYDKGTLYSKYNGDIIPLGLNEIRNKVDSMISKIMGNGSITLNDMRLKIKDIEDWIYNLEKSNTSNDIDSLDKIFDLFEGIDHYNKTLKEILSNKSRNLEGVLSKNDLSDILKFKLDGIEEGANMYVHPKKMQCTVDNGANSLNFKVGNTILSKDDIGLKNVDIRANMYIHPKEIVCGLNVVRSVNGKTGNVYLDKFDIGLGNVMNYGIADEDDIKKMVDDKYLTPKSFNSIIELFPLFSCSRVFVGSNIYGGLKTNGDFFIRSGISYNDELIVNDILDMAIGSFITLLKTDGTIKQSVLKNGYLVEYKDSNIPRHEDYIQIGDCKGYMGAAIRSDGSHVRWGLEDVSRIVSDLDNIDQYDTPIQIAGHSTYLVYLFDSGLVGVFGKSFGIGDKADEVPFVPRDQYFTSISAGFNFVSCIKEDGTLATYGYNSFENGNIKDYVPEGNDYIQVKSGDTHSIALKADGTIVGWGSNNKNIYDTPGGVFISIDCHKDANIAVSESGLVYLWGEGV